MSNKTVTYLLLSLFIGVSYGQNSPHISRVIAYHPAPGQHINRLFPTPEMSNTYENALAFAQQALVEKKQMVGLGAFGGYVIVGFDHPIVNVVGEYDFKGLGNAFPKSHEPGAVMVCQDLNQNGVPDDNEPWYELAGSEYHDPQTTHHYEITYYRPDGIRQNVRWTDNQGAAGSVQHISFAKQNHMYPAWVKENTLTFKGSKLRNTARDISGKGTYWVMDAFDYGYIDNHPNNAPIEKNGFKIEWAVDAAGNSVHLEYIDFIKVYTAQLQEAGWLGETSTELVGIEDLHPDAVLTASNIQQTQSQSTPQLYIHNDLLTLKGIESVKNINLLTLNGQQILSTTEQTIDVSRFSKGIYLLQIIQNDGKQTIQKIIL